jgi:hypothetical protein
LETAGPRCATADRLLGRRPPLWRTTTQMHSSLSMPLVRVFDISGATLSASVDLDLATPGGSWHSAPYAPAPPVRAALRGASSPSGPALPRSRPFLPSPSYDVREARSVGAASRELLPLGRWPGERMSGGMAISGSRMRPRRGERIEGVAVWWIAPLNGVGSAKLRVGRSASLADERNRLALQARGDSLHVVDETLVPAPRS